MRHDCAAQPGAGQVFRAGTLLFSISDAPWARDAFIQALPPASPHPMVPTTCCATQVPMTLSAFKSGGAQDGLRAGNKVSTFSLPLLKGPRNQLPPQRKVRRSHIPPPSVCPCVRPSVPLSQTTSSHLRAQACFPLRSARDCARACPPDAGGVGVLSVTRASPTEQPSSPVTQPLQVTGLWGVIWL